MVKKCASFGTEVLKDYVEFPCPACGEVIVRSSPARALAAKYSCKCGFTGP
ncbi:Uncharacterised protein [uncultured archaeon]|nr:Uncharacterised protein [uncultured archaeon]